MNIFKALILLFSIVAVNCACPHAEGISKRSVKPSGKARMLNHGKMHRSLGKVKRIIAEGAIERSVHTDGPVSVDDCDSTSPYQEISGACNNLNYPNFGTAFTTFLRLLPQAYQDGVSSPRTLGSKNQPLPNPRLISSTLHRDPEEFEPLVSNLLVHFGQFFAHDLTELEAEELPEGTDSVDCPCDEGDFSANATILAFQEEFCFSIPRPRGDTSETECFRFTRGHQSGSTNEQVNELTSFVDASNVYGSTDDVADSIREFSNGLLATTEFDYPPFNFDSSVNCDPANDIFECFLSGDARTSENLGLASLHLLFIRYHNVIAEGLLGVNPTATDEELYQGARRIVMGVMQHIVYNEWLPAAIGPQCELLPLTSGFFEGYDDSVNAGLFNDFATSGLRFGHTLLRQELPRFDNMNNDLNATIELFEIVRDSNFAYNQSFPVPGIDAIFLGMIEVPTSRFDPGFIDTIRNRLFDVSDLNPDGIPNNPDLMVRNIQRGRDFGLQPYYKYREYCSGNTIRSFCDLKDVMTPANIRALRSVYDSVFDVDVFSGSMHEFSQPGAVVGATTQCLVSRQMFNLKVGDRFYYENSPASAGAASFGAARLAEIRAVTMARVVCDTYMPALIQPRAFFLPLASIHNQQISCADIPRLDFAQFVF